MKPTKLTLHVPEQDVHVPLEGAGGVDFFERELAFYSQKQAVLDPPFQVGNVNVSLSVGTNAVVALRKIRDELSKGKTDLLKEYMDAARKLQVVIGQGAIGHKVDDLLSSGFQDEARWLMALFSLKWSKQQSNVHLAPFRAAAFGNPAALAVADLGAAKQSKQLSERLLQQATDARATFDDYAGKKQKLFDDLEELYRKKLTLDEPAALWATTASGKRTAWISWLALFAALVLIPLLAVISNSEAVADFIARVTTVGGAISIGGVAAISIPALLYAWLLKNVSRVFIQSMALADDAAHRRSLALTYLGLGENTKIGLSPEERAIALNALFRAIPPHSGDDGPPAGLLELVRKPS